MYMRYTGDVPADLPSIGIHVEPGDVIQVDKEIVNPNFVKVPAPKKQMTTKGDES